MKSHHPPSFERCVGTIRFLPVPITLLFSFSALTSVVCLPTFQISFPLPLDPRAPFTYFLPLSVGNDHFSIAIFPSEVVDVAIRPGARMAVVGSSIAISGGGGIANQGWRGNRTMMMGSLLPFSSSPSSAAWMGLTASPLRPSFFYPSLFPHPPPED